MHGRDERREQKRRVSRAGASRTRALHIFLGGTFDVDDDSSDFHPPPPHVTLSSLLEMAVLLFCWIFFFGGVGLFDRLLLNIRVSDLPTGIRLLDDETLSSKQRRSKAHHSSSGGQVVVLM